MRTALLTLLALGTSADALAGGFCDNACESRGDPSCASMGLGCDPNTNQCRPCANDFFCGPFGTCDTDTGACNIDCTLIDAGVVDVGPTDTGTPADAGLIDVGPADTGTVADASLLDEGLVDTRLDLGPNLDGGPVDVGQDDLGPRDTGPDLGFSRRPGLPEREQPGDECSCRSTHTQTSDFWLGGVFFALMVARRRRR